MFYSNDNAWLFARKSCLRSLFNPGFSAFVLFLIAMSLGTAHACEEEIYGVEKVRGSSNIRGALGGGNSITSTPNVGIYYYNKYTGQSQLVDSYYDPYASSWAYNAGYVVQSDSSFSGGGTQSTRGSIACDDGSGPAQLPPMTVSANVPMRIWLSGGYFARILNAGGGGGSGVNTVRVAATVQAPEDYTCEQDEELRLATANSKAIQFVRRARRGYDFNVVMSNGQKEHWTYMCGGPYCGPTVLEPSPRISPCN